MNDHFGGDSAATQIASSSLRAALDCGLMSLFQETNRETLKRSLFHLSPVVIANICMKCEKSAQDMLLQCDPLW